MDLNPCFDELTVEITDNRRRHMTTKETIVRVNNRIHALMNHKQQKETSDIFIHV